MVSFPHKSRLSILVQTGAVGLTYFAGAKLGLTYAVVGGAVSLVWPSSGIALAALLTMGYVVAPGIAIGSVLANVSVGVPLHIAVVIGLGATAAALAATWLLTRAARFHIALDRIRDVLAFLIVAAIFSTAVSALVGATVLRGGGLLAGSQYGRAMLEWWLGDMMGVLVVAPPLLTLFTYRSALGSAPQAVEACALAVATLSASYLIFGAPQLAGHGYYPAALAIFPFVVWAALRFDHPGASLSTLMVSIMAIWGTTQGTGPFASDHPVDSLVRWCAFANVVAITGLLLAAARAQERRIHGILLASQAELERRVQERTQDLQQANTELKQEMARRRQLEAELIRIGDRQQRLIGRELHDGLGQHLTSLGFYCASLSQELQKHRHPAAADAATIVELVRQASLMARKIAHGLDPIALESGGLSAALETLAQTTGTLNGIDCRLRIGSEVGQMDSPVQINLYRAAQEAVNNALKYSHGQHIWIDLEFEAGVQRLSVSDDGVGMDPAQMGHTSGLGFYNLRHRASLLGGACAVTRNATGGTTVIISYPVAQGPGHAREIM
ncbi:MULTISPECIES: MASE1 domain-containing protein [Cupriavidus]|uniref:histidine kinase n=1 Tax=Cupriavidus pinatubonensis (strain JMP 134 / LMG 1197) TaxID=264198 RepID=Q46PY7_CUPPJ|nr:MULTISPECIES: MASE1 domain-containing protein [Cupriavidus]TPQ32169.1 sensor histidine kinase [Cupriavidus pinatubonensis]